MTTTAIATATYILFEQKIRTEFAIFEAAIVATAIYFATTMLEIAIAILLVRLRLRYFCVWSKKCGEKNCNFEPTNVTFVSEQHSSFL